MTNIRNGDKHGGAGSRIGALVRAVPSGMISAFLSALLFTAMLLVGEDPDRLLGLFAYMALYIGAAVCGIVSAVYDRSRGAVNGALGGSIYSIFMLVLSLVISGSMGGAVDFLKALPVYGGCILIAFLMGFMLRPRHARIGEGNKNPAAMARKRLGRR